MTTTTVDLAGRTSGTVTLTGQRLDDLAGQLTRPLLSPGRAGWDEAVRLWNGEATDQPALVVQPTTAGEVAAAVRFARRHGLLLSVKGGGHHIAGTSLAPGGLTLDMAAMRDVIVDPAAATVTFGPGCRLQDVDAATQAHGLATVLGFVSEVGAAGLVLGGGLGYLTRRFGWAVDNLLEVEIVTADGEVRIANRQEHADLFWGVRGAGANLGVVTRFTSRVHPVGPTVYGGLVAWPYARADEVLQAYRTFTADAPRELSVWCVLLTAPPAPFVPPEWHGRKLCAMAVCFTGDLGDADRVLAPIRALGDPVVDLLGPKPYTVVQSYLDATEPKGDHYYWRTEYLASLDDGLLATMRAAYDDCTMPDADLGILHLGGALADHPEDDGAVGNRDARYALGIKARWQGGDPDAEAHRRWARTWGDSVKPFSTGRTYVNFQTADEGDERVRAAYGTNYTRLARVKAAYDPENLFRMNRNVPPAP